MTTETPQTPATPDGAASVLTVGLGAWIPVAVKLPKPHETVIVFGMKRYGKKHAHVMAAWQTYDWERIDYGKAEWEGRHPGFDVCERPLKNVTHWMPLPDAPNMK